MTRYVSRRKAVFLCAKWRGAGLLAHGCPATDLRNQGLKITWHRHEIVYRNFNITPGLAR